MKLADPKDKATRYLSRHKHYLPEALVLIRQLQAAVWPLHWHVCLGGGVLNHGYSNKDLDLYLLPIYTEAGHDVAKLLEAVEAVLGPPDRDYQDIKSLPPGVRMPDTCFAESLHYPNMGASVDLFVVRP